MSKSLAKDRMLLMMRLCKYAATVWIHSPSDIFTIFPLVLAA